MEDIGLQNVKIGQLDSHSGSKMNSSSSSDAQEIEAHDSLLIRSQLEFKEDLDINKQTNSLSKSLENSSNNLNVFQNTDLDQLTDKFKVDEEPSVSKKGDPTSVQKNDSLMKYSQTPKFMCESGNIQKQHHDKFRQLNINSVSCNIYVNKMEKEKDSEKIAPYVPPLKNMKAPKRCFSDYVQNLDFSLTNRNEQEYDVENPSSNIDKKENHEIKTKNFDQIVMNFKNSQQYRER